MASATVNGAAMAVSYVGNGGGGGREADSSPDGSQFSPYEEAEHPGHQRHHHHHPHDKDLMAEDDDGGGYGARTPSAKRPASVLASTYDAFTVPSATASRDKSNKKRRKQSNPVRLAMSRLCSTEQETLDFEQDGAEASPPPPPLSRGSGDDEEGEASPRATDDFNDGSVYRCPHCNVLFAVEEHLREHVEEEHVQKALERQLQQHNQKNQMAGGGASSLHASPFDLSTSSMAFRLDGGRTSDSSSSEPSMHDYGKQEDKMAGAPQQHPHQATSIATTIPCTSAAVALHSPKDMASLMALSAFGAAPFLIPVLPCGNSTSASVAASSRIMTYSPAGPPGANGLPTSGPPIRIFNPEAFCELCNKEFCNKYFLKTHKANKHGIYSVEALAGVAATTMTMTTPTATQVASYTGSLIAAATMGVAPIRPHLGGSPAAGVHEGSTGNSNGNGGGATTAATPMSSASSSMASVLLGPSMVGKAMPVMNPEAFCDICQKEFCNKYFLKKHRQKIHGIQDFSASPGFGAMGPSAGSICALVDAIPITAAELSPGNSGPSSLLAGSAAHSSTPSDLYYEYGARDLSAKILAAASQGLMPKHSIQSLVAPSGNAVTTTATIAAVPAAHFSNSGTGGEGHIIVAGYSFSPEHLREMGVINVDAFCELCCKEFCNKYFLRTHKQNKHGVGCEGSPGAGAKSGPPHGHQQAVPLSLVVDKENHCEDGQKSDTPNSSNCGSTNGRRSAGSQEPTQEPPSVSSDLTCDVCSRPFSSAYLLKMHKFYFHNIDPTSNSGLLPGDGGATSRGPPDAGKLPHSPPDPGDGRCGSNGSLKSVAEIGEVVGSAAAPPLNEDLQKLQTMIHELNTSPKDGNVKCNICFHEMKNKYFLRAHMMNEHGELHNEDEISQGEDDHLLGAGSGPDRDGPAAMAATSSMAVSLQGDSTSTAKASAADPDSFCEICCKDMCSKYFLRTHMMTMHGIGASSDKGAEPGLIGVIPLPVPLDKIKMEYQGRTASPPQVTNHGLHGAPSLHHHHHLQQQQQQQQHHHQQQQITLSSLGLSERPPMTAVTGRNFCEICNKELCNKYFMKTHMLKMHGINVDEKSSVNGATIGGVTCDICQKELCSKYFLKVHKQNTHGILEEPSMSKENYAAAAAAAAAAAVSAASMSTPSSDKDAYHHDGNVSDGGGNRYFSHYTEVCPLCDRRFKSIKWLKTHVINDHADLAKENGLAELLGAEGYGEPPVHLLRMQHLSPRDYVLGAEAGFGIKVEKPSSSSSSSATTSPNTVAPFHLHLHGHHQGPVPSHRQPAHADCGDGGTTTAHHHAGELGSTGAAAGTAGAASATMAGNASTTSSSPSSASSASAIAATATAGFASRKPLGPGNGTRIYHCSYCSYSTRWLSNLYAHEKRHTGLSSEGEKRFCCRICHRAYRYNHSLQRHLVSHKATGILVKHVVSTQASMATLSTSVGSSTTFNAPSSFLRSPPPTAEEPKMAADENGDDSNAGSESHGDAARPSSKMAPARVKKYRCSKCGAKYRSREQCLEHIHTHHNTRNRHHHGYHPRGNDGAAGAVGVVVAAAAAAAVKSPHNCPICPFSCSNKEALAAHLAKHQQRLQDDEEERGGGASDECNELLNNQLQQQHLQRLQNALGKSQLPMTYAVPQTPPTAGSFIMQPFLISQSDAEDAGARCASKLLPPNATFVPSLVYLPVSHKISETLTVAFTLSPA